MNRPFNSSLVSLSVLWWIHPTFRNRGTAYNSRSFAGNLLFVGDYGRQLMLRHDHFYSFKPHADVEPCKFLVSLAASSISSIYCSSIVIPI
jgi:hypothetical protein